MTVHCFSPHVLNYLPTGTVPLNLLKYLSQNNSIKMSEKKAPPAAKAVVKKVVSKADKQAATKPPVATTETPAVEPKAAKKTTATVPAPAVEAAKEAIKAPKVVEPKPEGKLAKVRRLRAEGFTRAQILTDHTDNEGNKFHPTTVSIQSAVVEKKMLKDCPEEEKAKWMPPARKVSEKAATVVKTDEEKAADKAAKKEGAATKLAEKKAAKAEKKAAKKSEAEEKKAAKKAEKDAAKVKAKQDSDPANTGHATPPKGVVIANIPEEVEPVATSTDNA